MATFDVAHIREQGIDLIIVPLKPSFGSLPQSEQDDLVAAIQAGAESAGLAGTVIPVWNTGGGRMAFQAPPNWHPFFRSISLPFVARNINRRLTIT